MMPWLERTELLLGSENADEEKEAKLRMDLDADYFDWKEQQTEEKKPEGLYGVLKNLTSKNKQ